MSSNTAPLKPQFFVWRPNGQQVPVIPVDELPTNVLLHGVPRALAANDTAGMTSIGEFECRHRHYDVEFVGSKNSVLEYQPDRAVKNLPKKIDSIAKDFVGLTMDDGYLAPRKAYGIQEQGSSPTKAGTSGPTDEPSLRTVEAGVNAATTEASQDQKQAPGTKKYCSFWLRRGECDFAQQGCIYKHEMPKDADGLESVGLRDFPQWYRERFHVPSLLAVPGSGAAGGPANISKAKLDKNWRSAPRSASSSYASVVAQDPTKPVSNVPAPSPAPARASSRTSARAPRVLRSGSNSSTAASKASTSGSGRRGQPKFLTREHYASMNAVSILQQSDSDEPKGKASNAPSAGRRQYGTSKPKFMTIDELVAQNAIKQLEAEENKEAERKARLATYPVPFNPGPASSTENSRPCSRASDESVVANPGLITPTSTSYESDAFADKLKPTPAVRMSPSDARFDIAKHEAKKAEERERTVHEARRKLEAATKRRTDSQQGINKVNVSVRGKKQEAGFARADERERQIEQELLEFGFDKENDDMGTWRADRWNHDD